MSKQIKRILALALCAVMVFGILPAFPGTVAAAETVQDAVAKSGNLLADYNPSFEGETTGAGVPEHWTILYNTNSNAVFTTTTATATDGDTALEIQISATDEEGNPLSQVIGIAAPYIDISHLDKVLVSMDIKSAFNVGMNVTFHTLGEDGKYSAAIKDAEGKTVGGYLAATCTGDWITHTKIIDVPEGAQYIQVMPYGSNGAKYLGSVYYDNIVICDGIVEPTSLFENFDDVTSFADLKAKGWLAQGVGESNATIADGTLRFENVAATTDPYGAWSPYLDVRGMESLSVYFDAVGTQGGGAQVAFYDIDKKQVTGGGYKGNGGPAAWKAFGYDFEVPEGAVYARVLMAMGAANGPAQFDNLIIKETKTSVETLLDPMEYGSNAELLAGGWTQNGGIGTMSMVTEPTRNTSALKIVVPEGASGTTQIYSPWVEVTGGSKIVAGMDVLSTANTGIFIQYKYANGSTTNGARTGVTPKAAQGWCTMSNQYDVPETALYARIWVHIGSSAPGTRYLENFFIAEANPSYDQFSCDFESYTGDASMRHAGWSHIVPVTDPYGLIGIYEEESGNKALQMSMNSSTDVNKGRNNEYFTPYVALGEIENLSVSMDINTDTAIGCILYFYDADKADVSDSGYTALISKTDGAWQTVTKEWEVPEGAAYAKLKLVKGTSSVIADTGIGTTYVDNLKITCKHTFDQQITEEQYFAAAADCVNGTKYYYSCGICGVAGEETFTVGDPAGHNYVGEVTTEPTFETAGVKTFTCTGCGDSYEEEIPMLVAEAMIGETNYATLAEAVAAAQAGDTITLNADIDKIDWVGIDVFPANLTLDGNGHTINGMTITSGATKATALEDCTVASGLTITGVTFTNNLDIENCCISDVTISDCDFVDGAVLYIEPNTSGSYANKAKYAANVTITGCTFGGEDGDAVTLETSIKVRDFNGVTITNNTITKSEWNGIQLNIQSGCDYAPRGNVVITGNNISGVAERAIQLNAFENANVLIQNNILIPAEGAAAIHSYSSKNTTITCLDNGGCSIMIEGFDAQIDETYYSNLAGALAAAESGDTVVVLQDATIDGAAILADGVTCVVSEGKTLTATSIQANGGKLTIEAGATVALDAAEGWTDVMVDCEDTAKVTIGTESWIMTNGAWVHTAHTEAPAVIENEKEATCTEDGYYDSVIYCAGCGEELSRETIIIEAAGEHNFVDGTCTECGATEG
ncbi:MAG: right-handed parallel beta-helix repeat-containing protein, partial [Ruminococcaceae bacterium]|nr:right-handed parallel beta-helix repeat-containing protein [Oscillospiraceae bacterium]